MSLFIINLLNFKFNDFYTFPSLIAMDCLYNKFIYIYHQNAHADSTQALAEMSTVSSTSFICLFLDYSIFPPLGVWISMCSFTTEASALNITTVLPSLRASFSKKNPLTFPVSSPKTTLILFLTCSTDKT